MRGLRTNGSKRHSAARTDDLDIRIPTHMVGSLDDISRDRIAVDAADQAGGECVAQHVWTTEVIADSLRAAIQ